MGEYKDGESVSYITTLQIITFKELQRSNTRQIIFLQDSGTAKLNLNRVRFRILKHWLRLLIFDRL